jgi:hypothetical protein
VTATGIATDTALGTANAAAAVHAEPPDPVKRR